MWSAIIFRTHVNHVSVSPTDGNGPTQGLRKTLTRVGIEPTIFGLDHRAAALPTELQGQTEADRGNWRSQIHGKEHVQVQGVTFMQTMAV